MLYLKRFEQLFRSSSSVTEVQLSDSSRCALKMRGSGNGVQSLLSEFVVNRIAHRLQWEVPAVFPVSIAADIGWSFGTDEFDDLVQRSHGVNLGIEWISEARPADLDLSSIPETLQKKMATLDAFFCNFDRLRTSGNLLVDSRERLWLVDHGSCRFLDPLVARRPLLLPKGHLLEEASPSPIDPVMAQAIADRRLLEVTTEEIPREWLAEMRITRSEVLSRLLLRARTVLP